MRPDSKIRRFGLPLLRGTTGTVIAVVLAVALWGVVIEPRFLLDVRTEEAVVPGLPEAWDGSTVAFLADFQVGMWLDNTGMVERAIEEALAAAPDLVLIGGDFLYHPDDAVVREVVGLVEPLADAGVPVIAVFGNHDYSLDSEGAEVVVGPARLLESELEGLGIRVLRNEALALPAPGEGAAGGGGPPLHVVGIGSSWAERSRPADAMTAVPERAPRLVLMHNPVAFRELPADSAPLVLAGHTHGGQLRLPLLPSRSWLDIARPREVVADGWAADDIGAPGNRLYVNRGIGFSIVPVRIRCRPELTLMTLRRGDGTHASADGELPAAARSAGGP